MNRDRVAGISASLLLCAATAAAAPRAVRAGAELTWCAPRAELDAAQKSDVQTIVAKSDDGRAAAPKAEATKESEELQRAYDELDKSYRASKRAVADEIDSRQRAGDKFDDGAIKRVAADYWPRFQALSDKGSGHARLWMALQMPDAFAARERATNQAEALKLLDDVAATFADEPWIGELAKNLTALYILLPEDAVDRIVDTLSQRSHAKDVVAEALYRSAAYDKTSKRPGASERADDLTKRLQRDYADTEFAKKLRGDAPHATGLNVGNVAPDFATKDADGVEFKLSDYRGKVVVLDFWGFW